jgi:hypothetical protein
VGWDGMSWTPRYAVELVELLRGSHASGMRVTWAPHLDARECVLHSCCVLVLRCCGVQPVVMRGLDPAGRPVRWCLGEVLLLPTLYSTLHLSRVPYCLWRRISKRLMRCAGRFGAAGAAFALPVHLREKPPAPPTQACTSPQKSASRTPTRTSFRGRCARRPREARCS